MNAQSGVLELCLFSLPVQDLGCNGVGNDIWGWTDPETGQEYAIAGCSDGSSFVDITDPTKPQVIGFLPTHTSSSSWRDMKVTPIVILYTTDLVYNGIDFKTISNVACDLSSKMGIIA